MTQPADLTPMPITVTRTAPDGEVLVLCRCADEMVGRAAMGAAKRAYGDSSIALLGAGRGTLLVSAPGADGDWLEAAAEVLRIYDGDAEAAIAGLLVEGDFFHRLIDELADDVSAGYSRMRYQPLRPSGS